MPSSSSTDAAAARSSRRAGARVRASLSVPVAKLGWKAPSSVSRTVRVGNRRASWNERARPRRARRYGSSRVTSTPPRTTRPLSSDAKPETASSRVVLPAPLGPMMPTTSPGRTGRSTPSTATTPPKRTRTPVTSRASSGATGHLDFDGGLGLGPPSHQPPQPPQPVVAQAHQAVGGEGEHEDDARSHQHRLPVRHRARPPEDLGEEHEGERPDQSSEGCPQP